MKFELKSKGWNLELDELTQGRAEIMAVHIQGEHKTGLHRNSAVVRGAIEAGLILSPQLSEVDKLAPNYVGWIAGHIADLYLEAMSIPKE